MTELPSLSLSADVFRYWMIEHVAREIRIVLQDGREIREPLADPDPLWGSQVALSIFDWESWWINSITLREQLVIAPGYNPLQVNPLAGPGLSGCSVFRAENHCITSRAG